MKAGHAALLLATAAGAALGWGEFAHWRASRALTYPAPRTAGGPEAIVVLGFRNRSPDRANLVNRWRVRAALRSVDPRASSSQLVMCGAAAHRGSPSEAALMARYARTERGFTGDLVLDERSRSTSENVANAIPLLEQAERIKIVSNPLHGLRARLYLQHQRPDLAQRAVRAADYRPGEWTLAKPFLTIIGLLELAETRKQLATLYPPRPARFPGLSPVAWTTSWCP